MSIAEFTQYTVANSDEHGRLYPKRETLQNIAERTRWLENETDANLNFTSLFQAYMYLKDLIENKIPYPLVEPTLLDPKAVFLIEKALLYGPVPKCKIERPHQGQFNAISFNIPSIKPHHTAEIQQNETSGDYGHIEFGDSKSDTFVGIIIDGVTDQDHPGSDVHLAKALQEIFPSMAREFIQTLENEIIHGYLPRPEATFNEIQSFLRKLHERLIQISREAGIPFKGTGLLYAMLNENLYMAQWGDVSASLVARKRPGLNAYYVYQTPPSISTVYDSPTVAFSQLSGNMGVSNPTRVRASQFAAHNIQQTYREKFNRPGSIGVIGLDPGYEGDQSFLNNVRFTCIPLDPNADYQLEVHSDGLDVLAKTLGLTPTHLAHYFDTTVHQINHPAEEDRDQFLTSVLMGPSLGILAGHLHMPEDFELRNKIDDITQHIIRIDRVSGAGWFIGSDSHIPGMRSNLLMNSATIRRSCYLLYLELKRMLSESGMQAIRLPEIGHKTISIIGGMDPKWIKEFNQI